MKLSSEDRKKLLIDARFSEAATKDIERQLAVIPRVTTFEAKISVDDDDDSIMEGDFVTAKLKIKIGRSGGPLGGALLRYRFAPQIVQRAGACSCMINPRTPS